MYVDTQVSEDADRQLPVKGLSRLSSSCQASSCFSSSDESIGTKELIWLYDVKHMLAYMHGR